MADRNENDDNQIDKRKRERVIADYDAGYGAEDRETHAFHPAQRSRLSPLGSAPSQVANAALARQMMVVQNAGARGRYLDQPFGMSPHLQAQQLQQQAQQLQAFGMAGSQFMGNPFSGNQLLNSGVFNPYAAAAMPRQPVTAQDQETFMRQLTASQNELLRQSGDSPPAMLLQLFAMQNHAMTQSMMASAGNKHIAPLSMGRFAGPLEHLRGQTMDSHRALVAGVVAPSQPSMAAMTAIPAIARVTGRPSLLLYSSNDEGRLTPYQCLARKHLEYFEADQSKVEEGAQGRNKAIVLGQVGIRCVHCSHLKRKEKAPAAAFYPSKLSGLYQSAQNIINSHLAKDCNKVPAEIREHLLGLGNRKSAPGGGKSYWGEEAMRVGVFEDSNGLRFTVMKGPIPTSRATTAAAAAVAPSRRASAELPARVPVERPARVPVERPERVPVERPERVPVERPPVVHQLEP